MSLRRNSDAFLLRNPDRFHFFFFFFFRPHSIRSMIRSSRCVSNCN